MCVTAEAELVELIGKDAVEIIHLGEQPEKIQEAEAAAITSVPALVTPTGNVLHINFGAAIADLKA